VTAPALLRQSDLSRMAHIAKRDGVKIEIERDGLIIRVSADTLLHTPSVAKEIRL
jgi:hypothetical protein